MFKQWRGLLARIIFAVLVTALTGTVFASTTGTSVTVYNDKEIGQFWDTLVKVPEDNAANENEIYWRHIGDDIMEKVDEFIKKHGPEVLFKGLESTNVYSQYYCINRLVEYYNHDDIRTRAIDEITPFLTSTNKTLKNGAQFAISVLGKKFDSPYIVSAIDDIKVFPFFNNYSDYGSYNELWMIKDDKLSKLHSFNGIQMYINVEEPIKLSPENDKIAVTTSSRRSSSLNIIDLKTGKVSPEIMKLAIEKVAMDHKDYNNTYQDGAYNWCDKVKWTTNDTVEFEARLAYNYMDIMEDVIVRYNFLNSYLEIVYPHLKEDTDKKLIIGSHYGDNGFKLTSSNDKDLVYIFENPAYMVDMVNGSNNGARKGGGVGALRLSFLYEFPDSNSTEIVINKESFKFMTDGAANEDLYQLFLGYSLGNISFLGRNDIATLGNGDFKFKIEKQTNDRLEEPARQIVGNRPIIKFNMSVSNKEIDRLNNGFRIEIPYEAKDGEDVSNLAIYHIDNQGKLSKIKNSRHTTVTQVGGWEKSYIQALVNTPGTYAVGYEKTNYSDVKGWYKPDANFVLSRGIMNDINGLFMPNKSITRADLAYYLKNMSEQDVNPPASQFKDISKDHPYKEAIDWAYYTGLIKGYEDGTFKPDKVISREELAVMLDRYTRIIAKTHMPMMHPRIVFKDAKNINVFAKESVSYLQKAGVIGGKGDGNFAPQDNVTRAECAKMIRTVMSGVMDGKTKFTPIPSIK